MRPAPPGDPRRRTIRQAQVVAMLGLYGWALEPDLGGAAPTRLLDRLVARGLHHAEQDGERLFDPAEAINHVVAAGLAGTEPDWRACFVATGRRLARSIDPVAAPGRASGPRRFRVAFERRFSLRDVAGRERLRLRLPRPIEDQSLGDLSIRIDAAGAIVRQRPGRIDLHLAGPLPAEYSAGFVACFTASPDAVDRTPLSDADRTRWLAPHEGPIAVTATVRALAQRLAGGLPDDRAAVVAFRDHLLDHSACGIIAYEAIVGAATDHAIATGWYDCQLGAALLVALCRARGMPARLVGGYLLWPAAPTRHVWCEIWLDGWRPFDPIAWDLSAGGRDADWRGMFAGHVDHRMKTDIWPEVFAGPMSLPFPIAHHRLAARTDAGVAIDHLALDGTPIYRDAISVVPDPA